MTIQEFREQFYRTENDPRLLPVVRDEIRIRALGVLNARPRNVGEAKRLIAEYKNAIERLATEVPW